MNNPRKLKKAVIRENLVALTGGWLKALILNQFIYWSERSKDTDDFLQEEKKRSEKEGKEMDIPLQYGWIYKNAVELNDELMVNIHRTTMRKMLSEIVKEGWLDVRTNPTYKWDRTLQYRPNIVKIQTDLGGLGYVLDGYPLQCHLNDIRMSSIRQSKERTPTFERARTDIQTSVPRHAIPETITEITTKNKREVDYVASPPPPKISKKEEKEERACKPRKKEVEHMAQTWNDTVDVSGAASVRWSVMSNHTENMALSAYTKLQEEGWQELLSIVAGSPFLNGDNDRGWRATFSWVLKPANLEKIMDGFYSTQVPVQNGDARAEKNRLIQEENRRINKLYSED